MISHPNRSVAFTRVQPSLLACATLAALQLRASARAQSSSPAPMTAAQRVDEYLERCTPFGFSGSVLVARGDAVELAKGYGVADAKTGAACAAETTFDLGSLSKPITAIVVFELAERGALKLDDRLGRIFPHAPADKKGITLQQLLAHTSGLPRGDEQIGSRMVERQAFLDRIFALELESKPGAQHLYSNLGYGLVAAAIEVATSKPFEDSVRELVLEPAGMSRSGLRQDGRVDASTAARGRPAEFEPPRPGSFLGRDASVFDGQGDEKLLATEGWWSWGLRGAGGVLSNVHDLWRLELALRGDTLLDAISRKTMFKPVHSDYACGWYVLKSPRGTPWIEHGGSTGNGFEVKFTRYPQEQVCIVSLSNSATSALPWVNLNVGKLIFGDEVALPPAAVALSDADAANWNGEYRGKKERFRLRVDGSSLLLEALESNGFEFLSGMAAPRDTAGPAAASRKIAEALVRGDTAAVHAVEDKKQPLFWFDSWWKSLVQHYGKLEQATVLGLANVDERDASAVVSVVVSLRFERGSELLRIKWNGETLSGMLIGGSDLTRRRLALTSPVSAGSVDLVRGTIDAAATLGGRRLELAIGRRQLKLERER